MEPKLTLGDFDYAVPEALVAQEPLARRDLARLLVRTQSGALRHTHVVDLTSEIPANALLILNESQVFPSRLLGTLPTGGKIELFLLGQVRTDGTWEALGRPLKKLKPGSAIDFGDLTATMVERQEETILVRFDQDPAAVSAWLDRRAYIPLPPYIKRQTPSPAAVSPDRERYQTVYAQVRGSVAAPTAGLHFTPELLAAVQAKGVEVQRVVLHVGGGTFLPVKDDDIDRHRMHSEEATVPHATAAAIVAAKAAGRPVLAVGTTTFRALEDLYRRAGGDPERFCALAGTPHRTELFVRPKTASETYRPWVIDGILTNFHQPRSTLFMLVAALVGLAEIKSMYTAAMAAEYRLFSYGDATLLWL